MEGIKEITLANYGEFEDFRKIKGIIYLVRNKHNSKCYIGQTSLSFYRRYRDGFKKCHNAYLKRSIDKYGLDSFTVEILAKNQNLATMNVLEVLFIKKYNSCNPKYGYNMKTGGDNGKHTKESLKRISEATKGKNVGKDNKNSKKTILVYKGETIIRDSRQAVINYMKEKYNLSITYWFDKGITYEHQKDVASCGFLNEDGTIEECNRNISVAQSNKLNADICAKETIICYKGKEFKFNSQRELIEYMQKEYNINCANWFSRVGQIPVKYQKDVISCGYLNEDGTIEECIRSKGRQPQEKHKVLLVFDGEFIVKNTRRELNDYMRDEKNVRGVMDWFRKTPRIQEAYRSRISYCGYYDDYEKRD